MILMTAVNLSGETRKPAQSQKPERWQKWGKPLGCLKSGTNQPLGNHGVLTRVCRYAPAQTRAELQGKGTAGLQAESPGGKLHENSMLSVVNRKGVNGWQQGSQGGGRTSG